MSDKIIPRNSKKILFGIFILAVAVVMLHLVAASGTDSTVSYCAEKTIAVNGGVAASCQNVPLSQVNMSYPHSPTACDSTPYCAAGTCVNRISGTCLPSPRASCNVSNGGIWYPTSPGNTAVCSLGCCLIGDQAAFTTKAACISLFSLYGNGTFEANVNDEATCLASAQPEVKGACVYDNSNGRTCKFTTKQNCNNMNSATAPATFHQGELCTNPNLETNCAPTDHTTCLPGQDQVYFIDSCGNPANVYDYSKLNDTNYWSFVPGINGVSVSESIVTPSSSSSTIQQNGNCAYYYGTTCAPYNKSIDNIAPEQGSNNLCRSLNCNSPNDPFAIQFSQTSGYGEGRQNPYPVNGETWCGYTTQNGITLGSNPSLSGTNDLNLNKDGNNPGTVDILFICANGQITTQISDYRNKVCIENQSSSGYYSAALVVNKWQDCYYQNTSTDCLNYDKRDCMWINNSANVTQLDGSPGSGGSCVPKYPPGFDTSTTASSSSSSSAQSICGLASTTCYVNYTQSVLGSISKNWKPLDNKGTVMCVTNNTYTGDLKGISKGQINSVWLAGEENLCRSLGDCGVSINYYNVNGSNTENSTVSISSGNSSQNFHIPFFRNAHT